jgi:predicted RecB family nuclease
MPSLQIIITHNIFEAYLKCPMKCWLRANNEPFWGNTYADWVRTKIHFYRATQSERLSILSTNGEYSHSPSGHNLGSEKWWTDSNLTVRWQTDNCVLESELDAIERVPSKNKRHPDDISPLRFIARNKLGKDDRLLIGFDAFVLSKSLGREISIGKIIHGDDCLNLRVSVSAIASEVQKLIEIIISLLSITTPPDVVLNRHCSECEFRDGCHQKATKSDDLSLLSGMPEKDRSKHRSKGIFSVTQLSYSFRPRRKSKRLACKPYKYDQALKALAIRKNKIHIAGNPSIDLAGSQVYFDVEGTPDQDFYYLIGLGIQENNSDQYVQYSFWADDISDERKIWISCLKILKDLDNPRLIHYGSYETTFLKRMRERYTDSAKDIEFLEQIISSAVNLLSVIYGQIYFPTYSNSLKEIARHLGYKWSDDAASGLNTLILRSNWEHTKTLSIKQNLCTYNSEDCAALKIVADVVACLNGTTIICCYLNQYEPN